MHKYGTNHTTRATIVNCATVPPRFCAAEVVANSYTNTAAVVGGYWCGISRSSEECRDESGEAHLGEREQKRFSDCVGGQWKDMVM